MPSHTLKRYPGAQPFRSTQASIFFGRDQDINALMRTISVNDLTVLHGKSGNGKTSLLHAGMAPRFAREGLLTIFLRLYAYNKDHKEDPLQNVISQLRPFAALKTAAGTTETVFMPAVQNDPTQQTLWQQIKSVQWHHRGQYNGIVLIIDQFEELFSYPMAAEEVFGQQLGEFLHNRMPPSFRQQFYSELEQHPERIREEELDFMEHPLATKMVIAIRSDRIGLLDRLRPFSDLILRNLYELAPLTREQAAQAIVGPARMPYFYVRSKPDAPAGFPPPPFAGPEKQDIQAILAAPAFSFAPDAIAAILDYLTGQGHKTVESTQIQAVCRYVEQKILKSPGQIIQLEDLGNIKTIFKNYYEEVLASLPAQERANVQHLIEDGLIFEPEQRRLSLYEGQILSTYQISQATLDALVNEHHLLRTDDPPDSGVMYELSHDSLVAAILDAKRQREIEEERQKREAEQKIKDALNLAEQQRLRRQRRLYWRFAMVASALFLAALAAAIQAVTQKNRAEEAENKAKEQTLLAQQHYAVAQIQRDSAKMERDSVWKMKKLLEEKQNNLFNQTYLRYLDQGKNLMQRKQFADATEKFRQAYIIPASDRNVSELKRLLAECQAKEPKEKEFKTLMLEADNLRGKKNYPEAYRKYKRARELDFANEVVKDPLEICVNEIRYQIGENLEKAQGILEKGKEKRVVLKFLDLYVEPFIDLLELPGDDPLVVVRNEITH